MSNLEVCVNGTVFNMGRDARIHTSNLPELSSDEHVKLAEEWEATYKVLPVPMRAEVAKWHRAMAVEG